VYRFDGSTVLVIKTDVTYTVTHQNDTHSHRRAAKRSRREPQEGVRTASRSSDRRAASFDVGERMQQQFYSGPPNSGRSVEWAPSLKRATDACVLASNNASPAQRGPRRDAQPLHATPCLGICVASRLAGPPQDAQVLRLRRPQPRQLAPPARTRGSRPLSRLPLMRRPHARSTSS